MAEKEKQKYIDEETNIAEQKPQYYHWLTCFAKKSPYSKKLIQEPPQTELVNNYYDKTLKKKIEVLKNAK
jgi:hypothetical protein